MSDNLPSNVSLWTREQLIEFLILNGFEEDLEGQDFEDLYNLVMIVKSSKEPETTIPPSRPTNTRTTIFREDEDTSPVLVEDEDAMIDSVTYATMHNDDENISSLTKGSGETANDVSEEDQMTLALSMCETTGLEFDDAIKALRAVNWNVSSAISWHYDSADRAKQEQERLENIQRRSRSSSDIGIQGSRVAAMQPDAVMQEAIRSMRRVNEVYGSSYHVDEDDEEDDDYPPVRRDEYDEDGIRLPDPVKQQRLVSGRPMHRMDNALARADNPSIEWLYPPAGHLSYPGTFQDARSMSLTEKKWLLVNIQSHEIFDSHLLNRDFWTNETIESIIRSSFYFWQRGSTSQEGQAFMRTYQLTESNLPHVCIIDCRTGARAHTLKELSEVDKFILELMEFLELNDLQKHDSTTNEAETNPQPSNTTNEKISKIDTSVGMSKEKSEKKDSPKRETAADYGRSPKEPEPNDERHVKVSIKHATGGKLVRRFYGGNTVRELYAFVSTTLKEPRPFDLLIYPSTSLSDKLDLTLEEASVAGSQIIMRWI